MVVAGGAAKGADLPVLPVPDASAAALGGWSGFYAGAHLGFAGGRSDWRSTGLAGAPDLSGSLDFFHGYDPFNGAGGQFGGLTGGFNYMLGPRLLLGGEADLSFPSTLGASQSLPSFPSGVSGYGDSVLTSGTVRGRIGYDASHWLYYVTGELAWTYDAFTGAPVNLYPLGVQTGVVPNAFLGRLGWAAGTGIEVPVAAGWSAKFEYLYEQFDRSAVALPGETFASNLSLQEVRVGLNAKLGPGSDGNVPAASYFDSGDWMVRGQTTFVSQYTLPFRSPYQGQNSLVPNEGRETGDATLYVGRRLWDGAELWVDPEIDQGFGLSNTLGVAGFTSGEAYKVGFSYPYLRLPRMFVRQTIDLGGDSVKVEPDLNQFGGTQTANRLVITIGKYSVSDLFDTIAYAHDPRTDFLNWTLVDAGTFDYAADAWGFTYGATAEWYQGDWTLRTGLFDLSAIPNSADLDPTFDQFQFVYELQHRHELWGQPGMLAVVGYLTRGRMGRFDDAIALAVETGTTPSTALVRQYASRPGVNLNFAQQLTPGIGIFARAGWADGNYEPYEFTDVDRTVSGGVSISGRFWNRADDTLGIAGVVNGISKVHEAYLNDGGLGILVGDGQLPHPGLEQIIETYYSISLPAAWRASADYQFIMNPAYNRDRGPASVIAARFHRAF